MEIVEKVWGKEEWIVNNELYCFKKLHLNKGYRCSMHSHKIKDETFILHSGKVKMETEDIGSFEMSEGEQVRIFPNTKHRFTGLEDSVIYEISTTHMEEDSYRTEESGKVE